MADLHLLLNCKQGEIFKGDTVFILVVFSIQKFASELEIPHTVFNFAGKYFDFSTNIENLETINFIFYFVQNLHIAVSDIYAYFN